MGSIGRVCLVNMQHQAVTRHRCLNVVFSGRGYKSSNWVFVPASLTSILKFLTVPQRDWGSTRGKKKTCVAPTALCCLHVQSRRGEDETNLNPKLSWLPLAPPLLTFPRSRFFLRLLYQRFAFSYCTTVPTWLLNYNNVHVRAYC